MKKPQAFGDTIPYSLYKFSEDEIHISPFELTDVNTVNSEETINVSCELS